MARILMLSSNMDNNLSRHHQVLGTLLRELLTIRSQGSHITLHHRMRHFHRNMSTQAQVAQRQALRSTLITITGSRRKRATLLLWPMPTPLQPMPPHTTRGTPGPGGLTKM